MSMKLGLGNRFKLGFLINTAFMLFEYAIGIISGSLILVADATHNLTDSMTLAVSWLGDRIARKPADKSHSLGHGRASVLAAMINSSVLVGVAFLIFIEAYQRFTHPVHLKGGVIAFVALVGIIANVSVASLFFRERSDINVKAAYTNMAFDAVFSVVALVAGLLIMLTGKTWIDPLMSIGVGVGLLYAALGILRQAAHIVLEGVPRDVDLDKIREHILNNKNIAAVDNLYAWAISSNEYVLCVTISPKERDYRKLQVMVAGLKKDLYDFGFTKVIIETA